MEPENPRKNALEIFINSFCTVHYPSLFIKKGTHKTYWEKLTEKMKKYIIQICVHQFFFSFFDRKYDNIIITDNGIHHIDTDTDGVGDWFMFAVNGHQDRYNKVKLFITFLHDISPNDKQLCNFFNTEIDKIKKIDYEKFVNRYIRNCIVLDITAQDAYSYLKDHVINKMYEFFQTTLEGCYNLEPQNIQENEYFKILKQGFTEMKNIIENNDILNKIMSNDEGEKWFTNEFQQKENELKNQNTTQENKNEEMEGTKKHSVLNIGNQDNINTNNMPKNNNTDANNEIHNVYFIKKTEKDRDKMSDNHNVNIDGMHDITSPSTNHFCNDCTDKCLSLYNSCLSLCSCRRKQTTETKSQ